MSDYLPQVGRDDVLRIVDRDYPPKDREAILDMLKEYGPARWHGAPDRVHLAILKLGGGNTNALRKYLDDAKPDFRDVVAPAEYPRFWQIGLVGADRMTSDEREQLQKDDWNQYEEWLNAKQSWKK